MICQKDWRFVVTDYDFNKHYDMLNNAERRDAVLKVKYEHTDILLVRDADGTLKHTNVAATLHIRRGKYVCKKNIFGRRDIIYTMQDSEIRGDVDVKFGSKPLKYSSYEKERDIASLRKHRTTLLKNIEALNVKCDELVSDAHETSRRDVDDKLYLYNKLKKIKMSGIGCKKERKIESINLIHKRINYLKKQGKYKTDDSIIKDYLFQCNFDIFIIDALFNELV